jgi:hypothetical protein
MSRTVVIVEPGRADVRRRRNTDNLSPRLVDVLAKDGRDVVHVDCWPHPTNPVRPWYTRALESAPLGREVSDGQVAAAGQAYETMAAAESAWWDPG